MIKLSIKTAVIVVFAFCFGSLLSVAQGPAAAPGPDSAFSISRAQYLEPEELNRLLQAPAAKRPLVLQVGSHVLFAEAHIPGSEYIGPGSRPAGLDLLKARVASLPHDTFIVLYCGCCPWDRCPNIAPAFNTLRQIGFTRVKVLYLADNFGADWVNKGFPVEQGR
jgi:hypothetical protein